MDALGRHKVAIHLLHVHIKRLAIEGIVEPNGAILRAIQIKLLKLTYVVIICVC